MSDCWILDAEHRLVPATLMEWGAFFEDIDRRRVAEDKVDGVRVSTVFLGIDHRHGGDGPPLLFETMTFGGDERTDEWQRRYSTWDEAVAGHAETVRAVRVATAKR